MNYQITLSGRWMLDIGLYDFEHQKAQPVGVQVSIRRPWDARCEDDIDAAMNYDALKSWLDGQAKERWILLEKLAAKTLDYCMESFGASWVSVKMDKPEIYGAGILPEVLLEADRAHWLMSRGRSLPDLHMVLAINANGTIGLKDGVIPWVVEAPSGYGDAVRADASLWRDLISGEPVAAGVKTLTGLIDAPMPHVPLLLVVSDRAVDKDLLKSFQRWAERIVVVSSLEEARLRAAPANDLWVIGGKNLYASTAPIAKSIHITVFPFGDQVTDQERVAVDLSNLISEEAL